MAITGPPRRERDYIGPRHRWTNPWPSQWSVQWPRWWSALTPIQLRLMGVGFVAAGMVLVVASRAAAVVFDMGLALIVLGSVCI